MCKRQYIHTSSFLLNEFEIFKDSLYTLWSGMCLSPKIWHVVISITFPLNMSIIYICMLSPFTSIMVFTHPKTFHMWLNDFYKWSMEAYFHLHGFIIFTPWLFFLSIFKIILMTWFKTSEAFHFALGWFVAQLYFLE
jgi:hypothetical protein